MVIQRGKDIALFGKALLSGLHLCRVKELDLIFTFSARGKRGGDGATIELFGGQIAIIHRNANTAAWAQLNTLDGQSFINDSEYLLT